MKFFKGQNKTKAKAAPVPRSAEEIDAEHAKLIEEAGRVQYLVYAYKRHAAQINEQILAVNYEKEQRTKLDKEGVKSEQV